jgi:hypothetical protein
METLAVVLVGVGLVGVGVGLVMVIRLRAEVGRLAERADRVAARVEALDCGHAAEGNGANLLYKADAKGKELKAK